MRRDLAEWDDEAHLVLTLVLAGSAAAVKGAEPPYPEFEKDRQALRLTAWVEKLQGSSGQAIEAARRLFGRTKLVA